MKAINRFIIIDPIKEETKPSESGLILTEKHNDDIKFRRHDEIGQSRHGNPLGN